MYLLQLLGVLVRAVLLWTVIETHYGDNAVIQSVVYPVEETTNEPQLVPTEQKGNMGLFDDISHTLTEEETVVADESVPEFVKSPEKFVMIEEIPTTKTPSDDQANQILQGEPGALQAKFGRASVEEFGNHESQLNLEDLENVPYEKIEPTFMDDDQAENSQKECLQEGDPAKTAEPEGIDDSSAKSGLPKIYVELALIAGGVISLCMIIFNVFLVIMTCNAYHTRGIGVETIEELGEAVKKSTKQVKWIDLQPKEAATNATSGPDRALQAAAGDAISPKMKITAAVKRIQRLLVNLVARCQFFLGLKTKALPDNTRGKQAPPKGESFHCIDMCYENDDLDIQPVACFAVPLVEASCNEFDTHDMELKDIEDLFIPMGGVDY